MEAFKRFILRELIFTILVSSIAFILFNTVFSQYYLPVFWLVLILIAGLTAIFHYSILQVQKKSNSNFATRFMMVSGIKMMVYLVLITAYVFLNPAKATSFLLMFLSIYLFYTFFEVYLIVKHLKKG
jgi:hypothetical protein